MKYEDAKATLLLEHCAERCGSQQKRHCENCEINVAIKAVDKQIAKKPITLKEDALGGYNVCPVCLIYQDTPYCAVCGQRLNWEVEE